MTISLRVYLVKFQSSEFKSSSLHYNIYFTFICLFDLKRLENIFANSYETWVRINFHKVAQILIVLCVSWPISFGIEDLLDSSEFRYLLSVPILLGFLNSRKLNRLTSEWNILWHDLWYHQFLVVEIKQHGVRKHLNTLFSMSTIVRENSKNIFWYSQQVNHVGPTDGTAGWWG